MGTGGGDRGGVGRYGSKSCKSSRRHFHNSSSPSKELFFHGLEMDFNSQFHFKRALLVEGLGIWVLSEGTQSSCKETLLGSAREESLLPPKTSNVALGTLLSLSVPVFSWFYLPHRGFVSISSA